MSTVMARNRPMLLRFVVPRAELREPNVIDHLVGERLVIILPLEHKRLASIKSDQQPSEYLPPRPVAAWGDSGILEGQPEPNGRAVGELPTDAVGDTVDQSTS